MYDKILVPTDGSEFSDEAAEHAIEIAEKFGSEVHFLHVVDTRVFGTENYWELAPTDYKDTAEELTTKLADKAKESGVETVTEVLIGVPHSQIKDYVDEKGMALVIMGTHGRTGFSRMLLGSVTEKVVRTSDVPVLTVS